MTQQTRRTLAGRVAVATAAALVSTVVLAGCSSTAKPVSTFNPKAPVTLNLTTETANGSTSPMTFSIAAYEKLHPNVTIKLTLVPVANYAQVLQTQFQAGAGPDVFWSTTGTGETYSILAFAKGGFVEPMSKYPWATKTVPTNATDLFTTKGKQYGIALDMVPIGPVYNLTALKAAGIATPPTTLSKLYADCATVKAKGNSLFNLAAAAAPNANVFIDSIVASTVLSTDPTFEARRAAGKATFAGSKAYKTAFQTLLDLQSKGCLQPGVAAGTIPQLFTAVASGTSMALVGPGSVAGALTANAPKNTYGMTAFPGVTTAATRLFASPSDALGVNAHSKHLDAALAFEQYMASPAAGALYAKNNGAAALQSKSYTGSLALVGPYLSNQAKFAPEPEQTWPNPAVDTAETNGVQGLLTGQLTIAQVLASMDTAYGSN